MNQTPPSGADPPRPDASIALSTGSDSPPTESVYRIPPDFLPPGRAAALPTIEGYEILRELHRGGQGVVYEAIQKSTHRKVAVKMLLDEQYASESSRKRFDREVKLVAQLRHPNIITVHDSGTTPDGRCYLIMDYVRGIPLRQFVLHHRLSLERTLGLFAEVCEAIHHAHQRGVIHRDLKPSNILVDDDGRPVVLDFGLAKSTAATTETLLSQTGHLIGTWPYMSPEQTRARPEDIDARSDVYALGVVLYELLTGHYPYPISGAVEEVLRSIRESPPVLPSRRWDSSVGVAWRGEDSGAAARCPLDKDLDTILLKALGKEPQRRYASAGDLASDIQRYLRGEPIAARRDSVTYILRKRGRALAQRHRVTTLAVVVLLSAAMARFVGVPLIYSWTPVNARFETYVGRVLGAPHIGDAFDHVRVIGLTDGTDFEALARNEGIEGVSNTNMRTTRPLHGRLMQKLASSGCRVMVWDLLFPGETPRDAEFVEGVRALRAVGVDVVVGAPGWWLEDDGRPTLSAHIAPEVRVGSVTAALLNNEPWAVYSIAQRGSKDPLPSLSLAALAAYRRPGSRTKIVLDPVNHVVSLVYWKPDPFNPQRPIWLGEPDRCTLTETGVVGRERHTFDPSYGLEDGDRLGTYVTAIPPDSALAACTISYSDVFSADTAQLRQWFDGKAVLVAELRKERDEHPHPDGRSLSGGHAHAAALDGLIREVCVIVPRFVAGNVLPLLGAVAGCLTSFAIAGTALRRYISLAIWVVLFAVATVVAYRHIQYLFNPIVPFMALWSAIEASTLCRRAWATH